MIIGIPFYGRNFFAAEDQSSKPNIGDFFDKNKERIRTFTGPYMRDESGDIAYNEICLEKLIPNKWENHWDQKSKTPYLITTDKLITYENAESIKYKVKYAFQEKLGGVMIFSIDQDDFRGDCFNKSQDNDEFKTFPMLRNLNRTFRNCLETHKTHKQDETRKQLDKPMKSFLISRSKLNKSNPIFTLFIFIFIYRFYL
ncbi:probable chitinase 2 [Onthophagus taurus]|uniref:probable chitinase 2 n=1 Tax=Onthophagus taurus TaxID=166361 RepID=UPI0039BE4697